MARPTIWTKEIILAALLNAVENNGSLKLADYPGRFGIAARGYFGSWSAAVQRAASIAGVDVSERTKKSGGKKPRPITAAQRQFKKAREALKLTQPEAGEILGVSPSTIARWEAGEHAMPKNALSDLALGHATMKGKLASRW